MRDNHKGLPEIIDAYERDAHYFCLVALTLGSETRVFEFGISQDSYKAIKRIKNFRPFEQFPGARYRYYFSPHLAQESSTTSAPKFYCNIRIEQDGRGKEFEIEAPKPLIANLLWFFEVKDFEEAAYLKEISQES